MILTAWTQKGVRDMVSELVANITNSDTPVLRSIYVPEGTVQFEFFVRRS